MKENYIDINSLKVSEKLSNFVSEELLKGTDISVKDFWLGFEKTINELSAKNKKLIEFREDLQKKIDEWHIKNNGKDFNVIEYKKFLLEIGYIKNEGDNFKIITFMFQITDF